MIRTQIQLTEEQSQRLKTLATEKGVSVAELIRRCIDTYIHSANQPTPEERRQRALAIAGRFKADITDLSTNHDTYLAEIYEEAGE